VSLQIQILLDDMKMVAKVTAASMWPVSAQQQPFIHPKDFTPASAFSYWREYYSLLAAASFLIS
jgi:exo-beta-1,3-glucanase (GH17 family)